DGVVKRGAAKSVPPLARRRVEVGAAVGDHVESVEEQLEAEDVVVPMPAAALHADFAAVDYEMRRTVSQHENAARRKCGRPPRSGVEGDLIESLRSVGSQQPECFFPASAGGGFEIASVEQDRCGGQQISVIVERLGRENLNAPIVGIADERRAAVRLGVRLNE